jgi:hypothetical protein
MEHSTNEQARVAQEVIQETESMLKQLNTTLTVVTDQIEEANTAILEVDNGGFPLVLCALSIIYNWDGQTSGPRTDGDADFSRDKTSLTSEVPSFCSNLSTVSSSNNY